MVAFINASGACTIKFNKRPSDKCLVELVGTDNGPFLYIAFTVTFVADSNTIRSISNLYKQGGSSITVTNIDGYIKITGLNEYGVHQVRVPSGYRIQTM